MRQAHAEVITDGTVGAAQNLGGPNFVIPQSLGSTRGSNLFHSFQNFNITNAESATFTGANTLQNVISRVTGGQSSNINGLLRSQVGQAAFYFINPAGVVFGADAVVDVPGDFHVSTANELRFSDGATFSATQLDASVLSMASPAEFGFLSDQSSAVRVEQSNLNFVSNTTTSLSGGKIVIDSGILVNEGGEIRLTAVGLGNTSLPIGSEPIDNATGSLDITNSEVIAGGNGAGRIMINAGDTQISNSFVITSNTGVDAPEPDAGISMVVNSLLVDASTVSSDALSSGNSGNIDVSASDTVNVINNGSINTVTTDSGNAGNIDVSATKAVNLIDRGAINSFTLASGDAGNLDVHTNVLTIDSQSVAFVTGVSTNAAPDSTGNAGTIDVSATEMINILNGGVINSSTLGGGNAGNINVSATETVNIVNGGSIIANTLASGNGGNLAVQAQNITIDGRNGNFSSGISSNADPDSFGDAGSVSISATNNLNIQNGGMISTSTFASGNAGAVSVQARNLTINEQDSNALTGIFSDTTPGSLGDADSVDILITDNLNIVNGGTISSRIFGSGDAGTVTVQTQNLTVDGQSSDSLTGIFSDSFTEFSGESGSIDVSVTKTANIINGGQISSNTFGSRDAGKVDVSVTNLTINNPSGNTVTGILSDALPNSSGNAGNVSVSATDTINIRNWGMISSSTLALGNAGAVSVQARNLRIDRQDSDSLTGGIFSEAGLDSFGDAGRIDVSVTGLLDIIGGGLISTSTFSQGDAGNVYVTADQLVIANRNRNSSIGIVSIALPDSLGQAGNITVNAGSLSISNRGLISTSSSPNVDFGVLALIQPATIDISAETITLVDSVIAAQSFGNIPAGSININASKRLFLDPSRIITSANNADGGDITLSGGSAILQDSQITTSVLGQGDGGNIALDFKNLVLDTGFIQANTAGFGAQGGDITINVDALTASGNVLLSGGNRPFTFEAGLGNNVIQAAAPDGVSGAIDISSPELNIKGDLAGLTSNLTDVDTLVRDPCSIAETQQSVLVTGRRGGLPETAQDALAVPLDRDRLQRIMSDPDISGEGIAPHQPDVFLGRGNNRPALPLAALEHDCRKH